MPLTFVLEGSSPERVRRAFRAAKKKAKVGWLVVGESFFLRIGEAHPQFPKALAHEFGLRIKQVANNAIPLSEPETIKEEAVPILVQPAPSEPQRRGRKPRPVPPKEELLELAKFHSCREIGEFYEVSAWTVRRWLAKIPEAKELERTYTCQECGATFTGPALAPPPMAYARHSRTCPLLKRPKEEKVVVAKISEDEALFSSLRERISLFDKEIARLEEEKERAIEPFDRQIEAIKSQREEFAKKILNILSGSS